MAESVPCLNERGGPSIPPIAKGVPMGNTEGRPTTATSYGDLTDYGPGKFTKAIDEIAFIHSLEHEQDGAGDTEYNGYISLVFGHFQALSTRYGAADRAFLRDQSAAVVETMPSGAVYVSWFATTDEARAFFNASRASFELPDDWEY